MKVSSASTSPDSFSARSHAKSKPDAMIHEPRGFLSHADGPVNLPRSKHRSCSSQPATWREATCRDPSGESSKIVPVLDVNCRSACLLPHCQRLYFGLKENLRAAATWAHNAVRPAVALPRYARQLIGTLRSRRSLPEECLARRFPCFNLSPKLVSCQLYCCPLLANFNHGITATPY